MVSPRRIAFSRETLVRRGLTGMSREARYFRQACVSTNRFRPNDAGRAGLDGRAAAEVWKQALAARIGTLGRCPRPRQRDQSLWNPFFLSAGGRIFPPPHRNSHKLYPEAHSPSTGVFHANIQKLRLSTEFTALLRLLLLYSSAARRYPHAPDLFRH